MKNRSSVRNSTGRKQVASNGLERIHRGDTMDKETRSALMSRIAGKNTGPEVVLQNMLEGSRYEWDSHAKDLPGRPDLVFREQGVVVFVDGDFWHGWRFPAWCHKLSEDWEAKILANRSRDARTHRKLRRMGWTVLRVWEHQLKKDPQSALAKILRALES